MPGNKKGNNMNANLGRPTKCTPKVIAVACAHIASGLPKVHAYALAGIAESTARDWERRGEAGEAPYADFLRARARATAEHVQMRLANMAKPGADWRREAWLLERLEPKTFAPTTRTVLSVPEGEAVPAVAQVIVVPGLASSVEAWEADVAVYQARVAAVADTNGAMTTG